MRLPRPRAAGTLASKSTKRPRSDATDRERRCIRESKRIKYKFMPARVRRVDNVAFIIYD